MQTWHEQEVVMGLARRASGLDEEINRRDACELSEMVRWSKVKDWWAAHDMMLRHLLGIKENSPMALVGKSLLALSRTV